ncbi:MAG TPA: peptidyl-prolyl cis-trans isomerase [Pyrinomonadaceae bacterium]
MKSKFFARIWTSAFAALLLTVVASSPALAQEEGVPVVVDEVIAQVNTDVVTLSMLKREMRNAVEALKQRGMPEGEAQAEVEKNRARVIANLIDEQLMMQKGKELPRLTEDVEAEVNREMLRVAKSQNIKTIEELDSELRKAGLDPTEIRQTLRVQFTRQAVVQREVDAKIYYGLTDEEVRKYYEANRAKFAKPESVELSEIYLSLAGKPEGEVRARAAQIIAQARGGADFGQLAATHSEREQDGVRVGAQTKGKVGRFEVPNLRQDIADAIKTTPKGGVSDPLKLDEGIQILRVDDRTASGEAAYDDQRVRSAMTQERSEKERIEYLHTLRKDAYIKLAKDYEALVAPLLQTASQSTASKQAAPANKNSTEKKN